MVDLVGNDPTPSACKADTLPLTLQAQGGPGWSRTITSTYDVVGKHYPCVFKLSRPFIFHTRNESTIKCTKKREQRDSNPCLCSHSAP